METILFLCVSAWVLGLFCVSWLFGGCLGRLGYGLFGAVVMIVAYLIVR
jgi:hypothetical protein